MAYIPKRHSHGNHLFSTEIASHGVLRHFIDKFDWTQEDIERETDQLCRDCGKHYFIPCTSHGLSFSCIPGVYEAVDDEIEKMSKELFKKIVKISRELFKKRI